MMSPAQNGHAWGGGGDVFVRRLVQRQDGQAVLVEFAGEPRGGWRPEPRLLTCPATSVSHGLFLARSDER